MTSNDYPKGRLPLEFFERLPVGTELRLYYWCCNKGDFLWRHSHVANGRVYGQCYVEEFDEPFWSKVEDMLYVYRGDVCRGSGCEPVHAHPVEERDT